MGSTREYLQYFQAEILEIGTLSGFKYFSSLLRGKEELVIAVLNESESARKKERSLNRSFYSPDRSLSESGGLLSGGIPYESKDLMISHGTQQFLSKQAGNEDITLRPASPSENESFKTDDATLFLLGCYQRYRSPYVWLRSNHRRLLKDIPSDTDKDNPLKLKSTSNFRRLDHHAWDVVAEVVKLCTYPPPCNPFALDFSFFHSLPKSRAILLSAAMLEFMKKLLQDSDTSYHARVLDEMGLLARFYWQLVNPVQ